MDEEPAEDIQFHYIEEHGGTNYDLPFDNASEQEGTPQAILA